jgi:hypothetical protein
MHAQEDSGPRGLRLRSRRALPAWQRTHSKFGVRICGDYLWKSRPPRREERNLRYIKMRHYLCPAIPHPQFLN